MHPDLDGRTPTDARDGWPKPPLNADERVEALSQRPFHIKAIQASDSAARAAWLQVAVGALFLNAAIVTVALIANGLFFCLPTLPPWNFENMATTLIVGNAVTGFAVAAFLMAALQGAGATLLLVALTFAIAGGMELLGTTTGIPFGQYVYTEHLGPKFAGLVPYAIPAAWFMMVFPSLHFAHGIDIPRRWIPAFVGSSLAVWDVVVEAAMTSPFFPSWCWLQTGAVYGVPLQNWLGWFATGWIVATLFLYAVPEWRPDRSALPATLYVVQSLFPAALAILYGRGGATLVWAAVFTIVFLLMVRRKIIKEDPDWTSHESKAT